MKYRVLSCIQRIINRSYVWFIIQMMFDLYLVIHRIILLYYPFRHSYAISDNEIYYNIWQTKIVHQYFLQKLHIYSRPIVPFWYPMHEMTGKAFLFLFVPQLIVFQRKLFLFTVACVSFQKFVESISPYRMYYSKQKQNILSIPDDNILCSVLNFRGNIKILLFLFAPMINRK